MLVVVGVAALLGTVACTLPEEKEASKPATKDVGARKMAPEFTLKDSTGKVVHLSDYKGKVVLLDFWATWCGPCRAEAPIVDQVSRRWRDKGVVVVGVNTDLPDQGDPKAFAMAHNLTYPIVHDTEGQAQRAFAVDSLPTLVVVSRTGKITAVRTGMTDDAELERLIRQAL
jgi:thiol-disulfide isomerase/thioredoxin